MLQESAPPFDDAVAAAIIAEDLASSPSHLFTWMSPDPVASASLGQVYQALLAADGRLVAVKASHLLPRYCLMPAPLLVYVLFAATC